MFNRIKALKKQIYKYKCRMSSKRWLDYLREQGAKIGEGTEIYAKPMFVQIDIARPWLIDIGKNVQITRDVKILTHGFDGAVLKAVYGDLIGSSGKVTIGDNCFIGTGSIILKGSTIGDNVIIGAGSVVTGGEYPSNCIIAGNPARVITTLDEYLEKRRNAQLCEAKEMVVEFYNTYGKTPEKHRLSEFFWLFESRENEPAGWFKAQMENMNNYADSLEQYINTEPMFHGYDEFIKYCFDEK